MHPEEGKEIYLQTDASNYAIISQLNIKYDNGELKLIGCMR